ncbi:DUF2231 domain-containing protein [candidate division KSB1 bacterium]|nr:DUF2231 domain-containing protein [candidate division KSB1 bacterium]NIR69045.1 DUF2231 domain-containing protein [candidate division KSB1 bacterium]NIS25613.1 DUF2231 domain-containing protein [candidate division KSB1 bacterium]NIT73963.1 DUF2231 domain-containing protein [candidate division KSB1 bacterium]NIU26290.1 DUF2231 domain-containing protein [candidate division KSB1 bacterium]
MDILSGLQNVENIHPLFVHFPIALVLVTLLFETMWWFTKRESFRKTATYLLYLGALSAVAAVITGYLASNGLGHDAPGHEFVHEHRDVMLWMSGLLVAATLLVLFVRAFREGQWRRLFILPLLVISGLLINGADKGGRLVFEYGTGVRAVSEAPHEETEGHEPGEETTEQNSGHSASVPDSSQESSGHADEGHVN